ncbi:hypothetical protein [Lampropedia cohaerens]|uniref:hypothetical protein n=1 Tax=Lampropedia cohaerens TaxID=1610491 RepID=UPI0012E0006F|nr:hypothetical protein [Lampropedia cohaerens]
MATLATWNLHESVAPAQRRLAAALQGIQLATALVLAPILYLIGTRLPVHAGWENGPVEMAQNFLLLCAALGSMGMALLRRRHAQRHVWWAAALLWLLLLGRELSWGVVLAAPLSFDAVSGPFYSSRALVYRPLVPYVAGLTLAMAALCLAWAQPRQLLRYAWHRRALLPWGMMLACLLYGLAATYAEGAQHDASGWLRNGQVVEEIFETGAYYFLARAQLWTFLRWFRPAAPQKNE